MPPSPLPSHVDGLMEQATRLMQGGHPRQAADVCRRVLESAPEHPLALAMLGGQALEAGQLAEAEQMLARAIRANPGMVMAHANLARVHGRRGDPLRALECINEALRADPVAWGAHMEKARLLESLGRQREAATSWGNALSYMPEQAARAPQLQAMVQQARASVAGNQAQLRAFLDAQLGDLLADRHARELERIQHTLGILGGTRSFVAARPLMLPVPRLPAIPYFHREDYEWTADVEAKFPEIRAELDALLASQARFEPYVQTAAGEPQGQFAALDGKLEWGAFFIWRNGERVAANADRCPQTEAALRCAPQIHVRHRAPVAFFSALKPGVHIPPHNGATNARLTVHLPLIIPEDCGLRVGEELHVWEPGKLVLFDDTIRHEAWNYSDRLRVVLIFDIWHPMLSPLERESIARIIEGMMAFYGEGADLGEL